MKIYVAGGIQNISLQVGDTAYYVVDGGSPQLIGIVLGVDDGFIKVSPDASIPPVDSFLMFAKDARVNNNSLAGYYASVNLVNDSHGRAELFALSSEAVESSK